MADKVLKVGLMGMGTVGYGVYKVMENQRNEFPNKIGCQMEITKILVREAEIPAAKAKVREGIEFVSNYEDIVKDPEIDIVVEVMGGIGFAKTCIMAALENGKNVVSANKDLIAVYGRELLETAEQNGVDFLYEASVAGAIPIIRPLKQCLAANNIEEVMGIVNGTTNYILTKMSLEGMGFDEALKKAQELGYAEADPTADIEGLDAARKVAIMASIAFHSKVVLDDVYVEGITKLTENDITYAKEMGYTIKLIGMARNDADGIEVRVHPMLIPSTHPLAAVNDSFNAVFVHGDAVDDVMFYGRGAGEMPTASAVVGDIMDIARNIQFNCKGRIRCTCYQELPIKSINDCLSSYFIRMQAVNRPGVLAAIAGAFGECNVSIAQFIQNDPSENGEAEMVLITEGVREEDFRKAVAALKEMPILKEISSVIRVYSA